MSPRLKPEQKHILRDAAVFALKLWLDGFKDFLLGFMALGAAVLDIMRGRRPGGYLFYKGMRLGHRIDETPDVYGGHTPPGSLGAYREPEDDLRV